jgi:hypothetical protein
MDKSSRCNTCLCPSGIRTNDGSGRDRLGYKWLKCPGFNVIHNLSPDGSIAREDSKNRLLLFASPSFCIKSYLWIQIPTFDTQIEIINPRSHVKYIAIGHIGGGMTNAQLLNHIFENETIFKQDSDAIKEKLIEELTKNDYSYQVEINPILLKRIILYFLIGLDSMMLFRQRKINKTKI